MNKLKRLSMIFLIFILFGCGAKVNYRLNVDSIKQTIEIEIQLDIKESDYEYIEGGREQLISTINSNKPKELDFSIDENDENRFIFAFSFKSYEEYKEKYYKITGLESTNVFDVSDYSKVSPFMASQSLEFNDDLKNLLNWLKNALLMSNSISAENSEKMISTQNYVYFYDSEDTSYNKKYESKRVITFDESQLFLLLKRNNKMDITVNFNVGKDADSNLTKNLEAYIKDRNINVELQHEETKIKDKAYIKYTIFLKDLDLNDKNCLKMINHVLGDNFCNFNYSNHEESSFFQNHHTQSLSIGFNFYKLFNREILDSTKISIDVDDLTLDSDTNSNTKLPLKTTITDGTYHINLDTVYSTIKYYVIIVIIILIGVLLLLIKLIGFKKVKTMNEQSILRIRIILDKYIHNYLYDEELKLNSKTLIGKNYCISLDSIVKVNYDVNPKLIKLLKIYIFAIFSVIILLHINYMSIAIFIIVISLPVLYILGLNFRKKVINIVLSSGRSYAFSFTDEGDTNKIYKDILEILYKNEVVKENLGGTNDEED